MMFTTKNTEKIDTRGRNHTPRPSLSPKQKKKKQQKRRKQEKTRKTKKSNERQV